MHMTIMTQFDSNHIEHGQLNTPMTLEHELTELPPHSPPHTPTASNSSTCTQQLTHSPQTKTVQTDRPSTSTTSTTTPAENAILSLLSLGSVAASTVAPSNSSPTNSPTASPSNTSSNSTSSPPSMTNSTNNLSPSSTVVTRSPTSPSPKTVAALERRISGGKFQFLGSALSMKENDVYCTTNLPPASSTGQKQRLSGLSRILSVGAAPLTPSLALALKTAQANSCLNQQRTRIALANLPPTQPQVRSPPRKIRPTHIADTATAHPTLPRPIAPVPPAEKIPSPLELGLHAGENKLQHDMSDHKSSNHSGSSPISITITPATDDHLQRSVSAPMRFSKPPSATSNCTKSLSVGNRSPPPPYSCVQHYNGQISSRSSSIVSTVSTSTTSTGIGVTSSGVRVSSQLSSRTPRIRVCIKPLAQIQIKASTLLDEARSNKLPIRTYVF